MLEKKLGLFTEEDLRDVDVNIKEASENVVAGNNWGWAAAGPFFAGGAAAGVYGLAGAAAFI